MIDKIIWRTARVALRMAMPAIYLFLIFPAALGWADWSSADTAFKNKQFELAFQEYQRLAEKGDRTAQWKLGRLYSQGKGVQQNDAVAMVWYRKAAEQGSAQAQAILGSRYASG